MPTCNFFIKYAKENRKGFCWIAASFSLPKHATQAHVPTHTCISPPITSVRNWALVYAGRRHQWRESSRTTSPWQARLGTAHSALPSPWGEGILWETASAAILLPGSLHRFPWNLSLALSCSWLLYTIVETPELWSPFPRGKLYGPQEGAKSLRRFWGSIPCRYPQQDKAPCCCHSSCSQLLLPYCDMSSAHSDESRPTFVQILVAISKANTKPECKTNNGWLD